MRFGDEEEKLVSGVFGVCCGGEVGGVEGVGVLLKNLLEASKKVKFINRSGHNSFVKVRLSFEEFLGLL